MLKHMCPIIYVDNIASNLTLYLVFDSSANRSKSVLVSTSALSICKGIWLVCSTKMKLVKN